MKVVITSSGFPPDIGGPATYTKEVATALCGEEDAVHVVCYSNKGGLASNENGVSRIRKSGAVPCRASKAFARIASEAAEADVILANGMHHEAAAAAIATGTSRVHKIVGDRAWERLRLKGLYGGYIEEYQQVRYCPKHLAWTIASEAPFAGAEAIIVPSRFLAKIVRRWRAVTGTVEVVHNAVSLDVQGNLQSKNSFEQIIQQMQDEVDCIATTVCRLVPWKGVDKIIGAVSQVEGVGLIVLGEGPQKEYLQTLAEKYEVSGRVVFAGHVSRITVYTALRRCDVFLLFSNYEGLPHVLLEAFSMGAVTIGADCGGIKEVVRPNENGLLVERESVSGLVQALRYVASNPRAQRLGRNAQEFVQNKWPDVSDMVDATTGILRKVARD